MVLKYLLIFLFGLAVIFFLRFNLDKFNMDVQVKDIKVIPKPKIAEKMPDLLFYRNDLLKNNQDFLEINLGEKKVYFYQQGQIIKTAEILKLGEKETWGGTPLGLYSVLSKYREAYSAGAEVYMPYALKFYGKYFLHGKPYYADGSPYLTDFSGGCVQVSDQDAKELFNLAGIGLPVLVVDQQNTKCLNTNLNNKLFPQTQALNYLVADLNCGEILAQKNIQEKVEVGSMLDFLEAVVVAEVVNLNDDVLVSDKAAQMSCEESDILETGSYYRAVELLYSLLSENSAKAKWVLAAFLGRQRTPQLMQEKAEAIMMATTTIGNIFSCDNQESISTAQELFYLARYLQNARPPILAMSKKGRIRTFGGLPFDLENLPNQNIFADDEDFVGGRVSVVDSSQYNGLFVFKNISIILLKEESLENLKNDALQIKDWLE